MPLAASLAAIVLTLSACGSMSRPVRTDAQLSEYALADAGEMQAIFRASIGSMIARVEREQAAPDRAGPPIIDFLALSGGGDFGAFGAGFMVGWGEVKDKDWARPDFDSITGVSTGALLAPFAYVGTDESYRMVEEFYRNPRKDWIKNRGLLFFLPSNPSFMTIKGLSRDVRSAVNRDFVALMAERSKEGKLLAVSATDLDLGRQRFWNLGTEAEAATTIGDPDRVQRIMMASAAIPAVFPPVEIDGSLYADGGVTANVFVRLDPHTPDAFLQQWWKRHPGVPVPRVRYWVIVNNQLRQTPKTVQPKWPGIVEPSLSTAIRSATIAEIRWLAAQADFVNAKYGTDIEVRVVAIPDQWRAPVPGSFIQETMVSLSDIGREMGSNPASWKLWTTPK
jgi:hypothetical protein